MPEKIKVTMELTSRDNTHADSIMKRFHSRSKASAVGVALAVTDNITQAIEDGSEIIIKDKDGNMKTVIITGM